MTAAQLDETRDACPLLEILYIDVGRNGQWVRNSSFSTLFFSFSCLIESCVSTALSCRASTDTTQPQNIFDSISDFRNLKHLELSFELGIRDSKNPIKPYVTLDAASEIFAYMRSRSRTQPSKLRKLVLHSGAPPPQGRGRPAPGSNWKYAQSTSFTVQLSERDDEAALGKFGIECAACMPGCASEEGQRLASEGPSSMDVWISGGRNGWQRFPDRIM